jgi:hypothetical protein
MITKINITLLIIINIFIIPINIFSNNLVASLDSTETFYLMRNIDNVIYPPGYISLLYTLDLIPNFSNILSLGVATGVGITFYTFMILKYYYSFELALLFTVFFNSPILRLYSEFHYTSYSLQLYCLISLVVTKVFINYLEKSQWLDWEMGIVVLVSNLMFIHQIHFFTLCLVLSGILLFWERKRKILYFILYELIMGILSLIAIFKDFLNFKIIEVIRENIQYNWDHLTYLNITSPFLIFIPLTVTVIFRFAIKNKNMSLVNYRHEYFYVFLISFLLILYSFKFISDQNFSSEKDVWLILYLTLFTSSILIIRFRLHRNKLILALNLLNLFYTLNYPINLIT